MTEPQRRKLLALLGEGPEELPRDDARELPEPPAFDDAEIEAASPVPVDQALEDRLVAALLQKPLVSAWSIHPGAAPVIDKNALNAPNVRALRRGSRRYSLGLATTGLLAAAACLLLLRVVPISHVEGFPPYDIEVRGNDVLMGDPAGPAPQEVVQLSPTAMLNVDLRPSTSSPVAGAVEVQSYLRQGNRVMPWEPKPEETPEHELKLHAWLSQLPTLKPGSWELIFVIGRPGHLPPPDQVESAVLRGVSVGDGWQIKRKMIVIGER